MTAKDHRLDYFKFYDVANDRISRDIMVQGQFDEEPEALELVYLNLFANPVSKNGEPIYDKHAHLIWYNVTDPIPDPTRVVVADNQFGTQKILTGRTIALLAPAQKVEPGSAFPIQLDHFKVYQVLDGEPVDRKVKLEDQFGAEEVEVRDPVAFAVPVKKEHGGHSFGINNEDAHLLLYRITPRWLQTSALARDQFGRHRISVYRGTLLAAPSRKVEWRVEG